MILKYYIMDLEFLKCEKCSKKLIKNLSEIAHVKNVEIDFDNEIIKVETDREDSKDYIDEIIKVIKDNSYCKNHKIDQIKETKFKYSDECGQMNTSKLIENIEKEEKFKDTKVDIVKKNITIIHDSNIDSFSVVNRIIKNIDDDVCLKVISSKIKRKIDIKKIINVVSIILGLISVGVTLLLDKVFGLEKASYIMYFVSYFILGYDLYIDVIEELKEKNFFNEALLMIVASLGALIINEGIEAIMLVILFRIGEMLETRAKKKSIEATLEMLNIKKDEVTLSSGRIVSIDSVNIGDTIMIKPFELVPLDSVVIEGESTIDAKSMTGESLPIPVKEGSNLLSGTINQNNFLFAKVIRKIEDSASTKLYELIKDASKNKSKAETFIKKFSKYYTPIVLLIGIIVFIVNLFILKTDLTTSLNNVFLFLVISCPCALVISVPLSYTLGISRLSREGVIVKGSEYLESFYKTNRLILDKTGTITTGEFSVENIETFEEFSKEEFIKIASTLESFSSHPIAKTISIYGKDYMNRDEFKNVKEERGLGVSAIYNDREVYIGKLKDNCKLDNSESLDNKYGTIVYLVIDNQVKGYIHLIDKIKDETKEIIDYFKDENIDVSILTGDRENSVEYLVKNLNVSDVHASLLPGEKINYIESYINNKGKGTVSYLGDGTNDAPSLKLADTGISIGDNASDSAKEASDIIIKGNSLKKAKYLHKVSKATHKISLFNIIFALSIKIIAMGVVISGIFNEYSNLTMIIGLLSDTGVTLFAILNSLRIDKMKLK